MLDPNVAPSPEDPRGIVAGSVGESAVGGVVDEADRFARLLDPNAPNPGEDAANTDPWAAIQTPAQSAAVYPKTEQLDVTGMPVAARTSDRPGYWQAPTQAQIDRDPGLAQQDKYYPPGQRQ